MLKIYTFHWPLASGVFYLKKSLIAPLSIVACTVYWACLVICGNLTPLCHAVRLLHVADCYTVLTY